MNEYILSLDQGATASRALLIDRAGNIAGRASVALTPLFPRSGWMEYDPLEIVFSALRACAHLLAQTHVDATKICAVGLSSQRETTVVWDRRTGKPIYNAIAGPCRRTADYCGELARHEPMLLEKTGLLPDATFSASKLKWILDNASGARQRAHEGSLLFGTVDAWLAWNLTGGQSHITDASSAARTMLFDINTLAWDDELCALFDVPKLMLPSVVSSSGYLGEIAPAVTGLEDLAGAPICALLADQSAALFGQGCFGAGMTQCSYGEDAHLLLNTGAGRVRPGGGLLSTIAWNIGDQVCRAVEGYVLGAGSALSWLSADLGLFESPLQCDTLAGQAAGLSNPVLVPAFCGLGFPDWDMSARGALVGLSRGMTRADLALSALNGIACSVAGLVEDLESSADVKIGEFRVSGQLCAGDTLMQLQADLLGKAVYRPEALEMAAVGAALLAGVTSGLWSMAELPAVGGQGNIFMPQRSERDRRHALHVWMRGVERARHWAE